MSEPVFVSRIDWAPLAKSIAAKAGVTVHPAKLEIWLEGNATPIADAYYAPLLKAMQEIAETTKRKQLPITAEINEIAIAAIHAVKGSR